MSWARRDLLFKDVDASALVAFRVFFGLMMSLSAIRFIAYGWVDQLYIQPTFYFKYYGFSWVSPLDGNLMYIPFVAIIILGLSIALGLFYRISCILFFLIFTYIELLDKSNYLNHYYFVSVLSFLFCFLPLHEAWSLDSRRLNYSKKNLAQWVLFVLRLQVGIVYFFAGVAKLKYSWLIEAQPMKIWLAANADFPIIGSYLTLTWVAYFMSWMGAFFDLTVPFFLMNKKTRVWAYGAVVFFHVMTWMLFNIGIFPWIMMGSALIFFPPDWPKQLYNYFRKSKIHEDKKISATLQGGGINKIMLMFFTIFFVFQIGIPLRHWLYPGNLLWTEEGFRFSWNVMISEKNGMVEYKVVDEASHQQWLEDPKKYLKPWQYKQMSTQPDMILEFAHYLAKLYGQRGHPHVKIYADTLTSLHGSLPSPLINPDIDLVNVRDSILPKPWIMPMNDKFFTND